MSLPAQVELGMIAALLRLGVPIENWKPGLRDLYLSGKLKPASAVQSHMR